MSNSAKRQKTEPKRRRKRPSVIFLTLAEATTKLLNNEKFVVVDSHVLEFNTFGMTNATVYRTTTTLTSAGPTKGGLSKRVAEIATWNTNSLEDAIEDALAKNFPLVVIIDDKKHPLNSLDDLLAYTNGPTITEDVAMSLAVSARLLNQINDILGKNSPTPLSTLRQGNNTGSLKAVSDSLRRALNKLVA